MKKTQPKYKLDSDYDFIILQRRWVTAGNKTCYLPASLKIQTICNGNWVLPKVSKNCGMFLKSDKIILLGEVK